MAAPIPEFTDDFMRLTVSPNPDGAEIPSTFPNMAVAIPEFPDDFTCLNAIQDVNETEFAQWERLMGTPRKHINFNLKPEITPANVALCPVHVRVPMGYNNMPDQSKKVGRLWLKDKEAGLSGNTVAFPIETKDQLGKKFIDFIFTDIAVSARPGRYKFFFQLMVKDEGTAVRWSMWGRMTSSEFEVSRYIFYGKYPSAMELRNCY